MLDYNKVLQQLVYEIDDVFKNEVSDYKGRVVNAQHVKNYLFSSYYRIQEIVQHTYSKVDPNKKILDIGIGYGFYDIILKDNFYLNITGMEIKSNMPAYCRLTQLHNIEIISEELSKKPTSIPDNSFDFVILSEVIEHLRISPFRALLEIKRILKPQGFLLLTTPNIARLPNVLKLLSGTNIIETFPNDDNDIVHITDEMSHIREYTMQELKILIEQAGYEIIKAEYSLSSDRINPAQTLSFKRTLFQCSLLFVLKFTPHLRSQILILAQNKKAE